MLRRSFAVLSIAALLSLFFVGCGLLGSRRPAEITSPLRQLAGPQEGDTVAVIDTSRGVFSE